MVCAVLLCISVPSDLLPCKFIQPNAVPPKQTDLHIPYHTGHRYCVYK